MKFLFLGIRFHETKCVNVQLLCYKQLIPVGLKFHKHHSRWDKTPSTNRVNSTPIIKEIGVVSTSSMSPVGSYAAHISTPSQILPLLMSVTLDGQERHLFVVVIDCILYKLDDLVRSYVQ
jgi:hypothetical protein